MQNEESFCIHLDQTAKLIQSNAYQITTKYQQQFRNIKIKSRIWEQIELQRSQYNEREREKKPSCLNIITDSYSKRL
jgi:hypothetical protein